jgi:hypothetical protein
MSTTYEDLRKQLDLSFTELENMKNNWKAEAKETKSDVTSYFKEKWEKARELYHKYMAEAAEDDSEYSKAMKHRMQQFEHFVKAEGYHEVHTD